MNNRWFHKCLNCYYSRFAGLARWCAHPDHHHKIENVYLGCNNWVDMFYKSIEVKKLSMEETLKKAANE